MKSEAPRPIGCEKYEKNDEGICTRYYNGCTGSYEDYLQAKNKYVFVTDFFRSYLSCNAENLEDCSNGTVSVPKWAFKAVADAFERHFWLREIEYELDFTLDDAFGISGESKQEKIRKLHARNKDIFFTWVNRLRMCFGLNVKDSLTATWKIVDWYKRERPELFFNFNASPESMLDAYYRTYPQHAFIQWVVEQSQLKDTEELSADFWMEWFEKRLPEAASFIKRKMKQKAQSKETCKAGI